MPKKRLSCVIDNSIVLLFCVFPSDRYEIVDDGLKVDAVLLENQKKGKAEGKYTCTANNGYSHSSHDAYLTLPQTDARKLYT